MRSADEIELEILRAMTPDQKLAALRGLWQTAWDFAAAGLRTRHPELSEHEIRTRVRAVLRDRA